MRERRLFAARIGAPGDRIELGTDAAQHARVLRLQRGDRVILFDAEGTEAEATIELTDRDRLACTVRTVHRGGPDRGPRVVLVQALPKGAKLDALVAAATEAGAAAIHLALSERSVPRPDPERAHRRLERLVRIAREAARQSERPGVPDLVAPSPLEVVARRAPPSAARIVFSPRAAERWDGGLSGTNEAWIAVGPEGGLSPAEEERLVGLGWRTARIEVPILRVEHAAPIAVALVLDRLCALRSCER